MALGDFLDFVSQEKEEEDLSAFLDFVKKEKAKPRDLGMTEFLDFVKKEKTGLKEAETKLLTETQEKIKYKFTPEEVKARREADSPTKWSDTMWNTIGEHMRKDFITELGKETEEIFTKEFWSETGKKWLSDAYETVKEETGGRQARWIERTARVVGKGTMYAPLLKAMEEGTEVSPIKEAGIEVGGTAVDYVLFIPKLLRNFATDPIGTIKNESFAMSTLAGTLLGIKGFKAFKARAKANKGWVTTGDFIKPIVESKMIAKQLKKKLLEVPSDIEIELGGAPLEIIKFKKGGKMPFIKHHWEGVKKDMKTMGDLPDRPTKYGTKKHPWLGLRIPLRTFEQYPWLKRVLYDEWRAGEYNALLESAVMKNELKAWRKKLPRKSQERVGIHADYMQKGGAEIMEFMGKAQPELTALEMQYYNWGQKVYRDFLPRLNQIRTLAGQKPIGKVTNYSTWIRNLSELDSLGIDILKSTVQEIEFHLNSLPLSMAKHRAKGILKAGVELDYGLLLENYSRQATRNIHVSPSIIKARTLLEPFRTGKGKQITWDMFKETPKLATWLEQWTDRIAGQGKEIPPGAFGKTIKVMNKLNKNIAIAILSYNVRSAIIQPSAFKNSFVYLGKKYLVEGFKQNLSKKKRAFADANSQHLLARKAGMYDVTVAMMKEVPVGQRFGQAKQAFGQAGMAPLQWLDYQTARATWLGAYEMATKKYRWKHKRAVTWADDVVVKTQASAQIGDIAPIQGTPLGKFMTLFQTFVINDYDMLTHDVFGFKNPYMNVAQKQKAMGRYVLATAVTNAVYEGVLKIRSPYPAPEWAIKRSIEEGDSFIQAAFGVGMEMAEVYPIWGGTARWSSPYRIAYPAFMQKAIVDPFQMVKRLEAKPSITKDQAEWAATVLGIGGTSQFFKYLRRRKRGQSMSEAVLGVRAETRGKKKKSSW